MYNIINNYNNIITQGCNIKMLGFKILSHNQYSNYSGTSITRIGKEIRIIENIFHLKTQIHISFYNFIYSCTYLLINV